MSKKLRDKSAHRPAPEFSSPVLGQHQSPSPHPMLETPDPATLTDPASSSGSPTGSKKASSEIGTVEINPPKTPLMSLRIGTRVKWHVTATTTAKPVTPGMMVILPPKGTLFGRVAPRTQTAADGWLYVHEEGSGRVWALNPATDHITVLSAP